MAYYRDRSGNGLIENVGFLFYDPEGTGDGGTADAVLLARANHTGTQLSTTISDLTETVQDLVSVMFSGGVHTNFSIAYDDTTGTFAVTVTGGGGGLTQEQAEDIVAAQFAAGTHTKINVVYNDATGSISLAVTGLAISDVASLQAALDLKAPLASPPFTGIPTAPTAALSTNTTQLSTTAFVQAAIAALIASAPGALDTLDELAAAFGDDANFASTVTTALAGKQPLDADLTAIALLVTTTYGRSLLTLADQAALRTAVGTAALAYLATVGTAQIDNSSVTLAKIANITTARFLGRVTAASGVVEELTAAQMLTALNVAAGATANSAATEAEVWAGTDTAKFITPAELKGRECIIVACSDEATALTTGTGKTTFRMPYAFKLAAVRATVNVAPTGATLLTIDINESGVSILSTKLTFDAGEKTTTTAATPAVLSDTLLADDAEISIDNDAVGNTIAGAGLKVYLIGNRDA